MPSSSSDVAAVLAQAVAGGSELGFRAGVVHAWNAVTGQNTVDVQGALLSDLPFLTTTEALAIRVGDVVGILRVPGQYFILGRIQLTPGEIIVRGASGETQVLISRTTAGGGQIRANHPNGEAAVFIGDLINDLTGLSVGSGLLVQQDNARDLLHVGPIDPGGPPLVRMRSPEEDLVFSTDDGGSGMLSRPYLEVPLYVDLSSGTYEWNSNSEGVLWRGRLYVTHPYLHVQVIARCGAATTGQLRVRVGGIGGTVIGSDPISSTSDTFIDFGGPMQLPQAQLDAPYSFHQLVITAQRTAGASLVIARPYGVTKRGTP